LDTLAKLSYLWYNPIGVILVVSISFLFALSFNEKNKDEAQ